MFTQKESLILKFRFVLTLLILFTIGEQVFAEQRETNDSEDFFEMSLEDLMEVEVVSASRQAQKMGELSVPVSVVSAEDIHNSGLTSIPEILQFTPGMDVLRLDRNRYAVGVRGLRSLEARSSSDYPL
jgi:iron complex outermembrane receptor protein